MRTRMAFVFLAAIALPFFSAAAVTFTNDTVISPFTTNYEGAAVVVDHCTITIDGQHSFSSLQLLNHAVVTHSASGGALLTNLFSVIGEVQLLSHTNPAILANPGVLPNTVVVHSLSGAVVFTNGADYQVLSNPTNNYMSITLVPGSAIPEGSLNFVDYQFQILTPAGLNLSISGDALLFAGTSINADGRGYAGGFGPGAGRRADGSINAGGGAGHGGSGGGVTNSPAVGGVTYDSLPQPANLGSGGGSGTGGLGSPGGGSVQLSVGGTLRLDGSISVNSLNATNGRSGGGSGGSIWVSAGIVSGTGSFQAMGGNGEPTQGGGGGGGRIALQYGQNLFAGIVTARGGLGYTPGGAGTIYLKANSQLVGKVIIDNGGRSGRTPLPSSTEAYDLSVQGAAIVSPPAQFTVGNLTLASTAQLSISNQVLTVRSNASIEAGAGISADGLGFVAGQGNGAGHYVLVQGLYVGGGGGYGGYGGLGDSSATGGSTYGSVSAPINWGSGGGSQLALASSGGAGGGAIRLAVLGLLTLNGSISADGTDGVAGGSGGGSGGSVWLTVGALAGSGLISANGGMGNGFGFYSGGGGGGGRVAIQTTANLFSGLVTAWGGAGNVWGGAGTIYTLGNSKIAQVLVDNGDEVGAMTSWNGERPTDLTVQRGAVVVLTPGQSLGNLLVASNSSIVVSNMGTSSITISGNAIIQPGGAIIADGRGYAAGLGPGAGRFSSQPTNSAGGAGYGGYGAAGSGTTLAAGGATYGSLISPIVFGSGGGNYNSSFATGGAGGGLIYLTVSGSLQVDGRISADGLAATGFGAGGGGAGGSVWLSAAILAGSGIISANGGAGSTPTGGGGGGGRIAITYSTNAFSGMLAAYGGGGVARGGAGTIYLKPNNSSIGQLLVDNGGLLGTNTTWTASGTIDLTVQGGAVVAAPAQQSFGNLLVASNGWLVLPSFAGGPVPFAFSASSNATILAGGGILADGMGYASGLGPGAGRAYPSQGGYAGGGGAYGGFGAMGGTNTLAAGGVIYGSLTSPSDPGSGGGNSSTLSLGGPGGGAIKLTVTGALRIDGKISANGLPGISSGGGGGAGGSIWLTAGTLSGNGVISANGGSGNGTGGGGGGGRIALQYGANAFSGNLLAYGGGGYAIGGAGTIFTKANSQSYGQVLVDNGDQAGTNTSWLTSGLFDLTIRGGAIVAPPSFQSLGSLLVASNGFLLFSIQTVTVNNSATIQAGGAILADRLGYSGGQGNGSGRNFGTIGGGGGYGGAGSNGSTNLATGGTTYGSVVAPIDRGSGGSGINPLLFGGLGGGAVHLNVTGTLLLNGRVSADGGLGLAPGGGGGSGGSIWMTAGTLAGNGVISANGGAGNATGGGGGGGRIALQYTANDFSGSLSARGGRGPILNGGAGTIYTKANNQLSGQVLLDNGGRAGTNTPLESLSAPFDLTLANGASATVSSSPLTLSNLIIRAGGLLSARQRLANLQVVVLGDATIQTNGAISVNGAGYPAGGGSGSGVSSNNFGSGAGYGGPGGASSTAPGGLAYGSAQQPVDFGSGGGQGYLAYESFPDSSAGGGALRLSVGRTLIVNGSLTANGNPALIDQAGGGSGGSIWVTAGAFGGDGVLAADGGAGDFFLAGGGAGGRIAIYAPINGFVGLLSAAGGAGFASGRDGTLFYSPTNFSPTIQGRVADTNGQPLAGVIVQPSGGLASATTDTNGNYTLSAPAGATVTVIPSASGRMFLPSSRTLTAIAAPASGQDFVGVTSVNPAVTLEVQSPYTVLHWHGLSGVIYQAQYSIDLVNWLPYGGTLIGANAPLAVSIPFDGNPSEFFRVQATY
jgi:hypothetical protein